MVRERSDLGSSRKVERRNEATARASYERLGSLSRAVSVDAYTEGQGKTNVDLDLDVMDAVRVLCPPEIRMIRCMPRSSV